MRQAIAFAPASIGNVAVGFDVLGQAIAGIGDRVTARKSAGCGVRIGAIRGLPCRLPADASRNTAGKAAAAVLEAADAEFGIVLDIEKGIPVGSGMGGSAASAVAGAMAANALLDKALSHPQLLQAAIAGEALASGGQAHADNLAPALHGGLTLVEPRPPWRVTPLPAPGAVLSVVVHPQLSIETSASRGLLADSVALPVVVDQISALAGFVAGCYRDDVELIARSLRDPLVEPQRAYLVPGFADVQRAALDTGALGCSLSGSGPSIFAWTPEASAAAVGAAMQSVFASRGIRSRCWVSAIDAPGATVKVTM